MPWSEFEFEFAMAVRMPARRRCGGGIAALAVLGLQAGLLLAPASASASGGEEAACADSHDYCIVGAGV